MSDNFGNTFREAMRFGSAAWAQEDDLYHAGLLGGDKGLRIGFYNNQPVRLDSDAPLTLIGGSGSGKMRDFLGYIAADSAGRNSIWNDPKGETYACFAHNHALDGDQCFAYNPFGLLPDIIPQHRINLLDILTPDSPTLQADALIIAKSLVIASKGENSFFGLRAQGFLSALMVTLTLKDGAVTLKTLMEAVSMIEGNPVQFCEIAEYMMETPFQELHRTAGEIISMMENNRKMLSSILGEVYGQCAVLDLHNVIESLSGSDMSLGDFNHTSGLHLYLIVPAQQQAMMAPVLRLFYQVAMLYKARNAQAPRLHLFIDEAAQLGKADFLLQAYTYGRGIGIRTLAAWQDIGQIKSLYGADALSTMLGSSEARIFSGIRDYDTAKYVSDTLGYETLEYDDEPRQQEAHNRKMQAIHETLSHGNDMLGSAKAYAHYHKQEQHRAKQTRLLMTPSEILSMPENRMIGLVSGRNLQPIYMEKCPYFERLDREYFRDNPYY